MVVRRKPAQQQKGSSWGGARYATPRRKFCPFCADKVEVIDYKDAEKLHRYILDGGKIAPRRKTGTCARHQRAVATAIKRARHLALLPYVPAHVQKAGSAARSNSPD
jgi:small subunit ribosomal protein S18